MLDEHDEPADADQAARDDWRQFLADREADEAAADQAEAEHLAALDDGLSPEDAKAVDDAVERLKRERGYPAPTPAGDLLRALHDPLGYWEERCAEAEAARDHAERLAHGWRAQARRSQTEAEHYLQRAHEAEARAEQAEAALARLQRERQP